MAIFDYKTEFGVNLHGDRCVKTVSDALESVGGVREFSIDKENQTIVVSGSAAPSKIARALRDTGKEVIVRGSGSKSGVGAAVCMFESFVPHRQLAGKQGEQSLFGLARFVKTDDGSATLLDLTMQDKPDKGEHAEDEASRPQYDVYIGKTGNLSDGINSVGGIYKFLGTVTVDKAGYADIFKEFHKNNATQTGDDESEGLEITNIIGRALVIKPSGNRPLPTLIGVIARSAGLWGNEKTVCTCSGKTMWEEYRQQKSSL